MEVLTLREFCHRRGYDVEISHDRLRFPHGISKRQARDNRRAANHHLQEFCRAARDYSAAVADGVVRPPTAAEESVARLGGHVDHQSVRATWRVAVKAWMRRHPGATAEQAVLGILEAHLGGTDPWTAEFGLREDASVEQIVAARLAWMREQSAVEAA